MSSRTVYTDSFREQALEKAFNCGDASVTRIAEQLNIPHWTLKNWMTKARRLKPQRGALPNSPGAARPSERSGAERMQLLLDSHGLEGEALGAFCRQISCANPANATWSPKAISSK